MGLILIAREYLTNRTLTALFVAVIFFMGTIFGVIATRMLDPEQKAELVSYLHRFIKDSGEQGRCLSGFALLKHSVSQNVVVYSGLTWILGLSVIGAPLILVIVFLRGFALGFTGGFLVNEMTVRGVAVLLTSVLPHNVFAVPGILLAATGGITFSICGARVLFAGSHNNASRELLVYSCVILAAALVLGFSALIEAYVTPVLTGLACSYL